MIGEEWLVVDGYNVIRADPHYSQDWELARDELIHDLIEYQSVSGMKIFVVFDAYRMKGQRFAAKEKRIAVIFTDNDETADAWIERFVRENKADQRQIYVATSDFLEQRIILGLGAYRISARELLEKIAKSKQHVHRRLKQKHTQKTEKNPLWESIPEAIRNKLEKLRRKK